MASKKQKGKRKARRKEAASQRSESKRIASELTWRVTSIHNSRTGTTTEYGEGHKPQDKTIERATTITVEITVDGKSFHRTLHGGAMGADGLDKLIRRNTVVVSPPKKRSGHLV